MNRFNKLINAFGNMPQILEGIRNKVFTKAEIEEIAKIRWDICTRCKNFDPVGTYCAVPGTAPCCKDCGCILNLKVRSMSASCPIGEWNAFMDKETEEELKNNLEN